MAQRDEWGRPLYSGKNDGVYWSREEWGDEHDDDPSPDEDDDDDDAVDFDEDASDNVEEPDEDIDGDDVECDDWGY